MSIEEILNIEPYSLDKEAKRKLLTERLQELTRKHYAAIDEDRRKSARNIVRLRDQQTKDSGEDPSLPDLSLQNAEDTPETQDQQNEQNLRNQQNMQSE